jgi:hypothetical protein
MYGTIWAVSTCKRVCQVLFKVCLRRHWSHVARHICWRPPYTNNEIMSRDIVLYKQWNCVARHRVSILEEHIYRATYTNNENSVARRHATKLEAILSVVAGDTKRHEATDSVNTHYVWTAVQIHARHDFVVKCKYPFRIEARNHILAGKNGITKL